MQALAEAEFDEQGLISLIPLLDRLGFRSQAFRIMASQALSRLSKEGEGLPDEACDLLERWLGEPWEIEEDERRGDKSRGNAASSVLWGYHSHFALPNGSYFTLHTLTYGLLQRIPPATERWIRDLEAHIERAESAATWRAAADDLRWLKLGETLPVTRFVRRLFQRFPSVRDSSQGSVMLAHVWRALEERSLQSWVQALRNGAWRRGAQASGELIVLGSLLHGGSEWADQGIEAFLAEDPVSDRGNEVCKGIGFAAARLWDDAATRDRANAIIVRLLQRGIPEVSAAAMDVFAVSDALPADACTCALLECVAECPEAMMGDSVEQLIECLSDFLPNEPDLVLRICKVAVDQRGEEIRSIRYSLATSAPHLVNIALTLQRLGGEFRSKGLDLFEQLLELGVPDAQSTINELDIRPVNVARREPRRRRRRRRG